MKQESEYTNLEIRILKQEPPLSVMGSAFSTTCSAMSGSDSSRLKFGAGTPNDGCAYASMPKPLNCMPSPGNSYGIPPPLVKIIVKGRSISYFCPTTRFDIDILNLFLAPLNR